jgi:diguanylate cyclase (GGDEF)-like protein
MDKMCDFCPCFQLDEEPDKTITWEEHIPELGMTVLHSDCYITWHDGSTVHLQHAIDVTDILKVQESLKIHENILRAVNLSAALLLKADEDKNINATLTASLEIIGRSVDADFAHLWRSEDAGGETRFVQTCEWLSSDGELKIALPADAMTNLSKMSIWRDSFDHQGYFGGPVSKMSPEAKEYFGKYNAKSVVFIPLKLRGELWGIFSIGSCTYERDFNDEEVSILRSVCLMMVSAVNRRTLASKIKEANERLMLMLDTSPLCAQIWNRNLETIDCNEAAVRLYGFKDKAEYAERFLAECSPEYQPDGRRSDEKAVELVHQAFEEGYCVVGWMHRMPADDSPIPAEITLVRAKYGEGDVVIGYTRDLRDITNMEQKIRVLERENEKVFYDSLTGIYNRRYFDESMGRVLRSLARTDGLLSLLMIDIDYFKNYNDTYGHSAGDECLKKISGILSESILRVDDFVARYGGEEFTAVLPNTDKDGAIAIAEKMLESVREQNIPHGASSAGSCVTVSIGVATGRVQRDQTLEIFVNKADAMLYVSKQGGRDRYTAASI